MKINIKNNHKYLQHLSFSKLMESEEIEFINFRPQQISAEDILYNIKQLNSIDSVKSYAHDIFYNGKINIKTMSFLKKYNESKSFLQELERIRIKDKKEQQECFNKYKNDINCFVQLILQYIYICVENYINKIILYGSAVPFFFTDYSCRIEKLKIDDIDVATNDPENLCQYIKNNLLEYRTINKNHDIKIKNIQIRKRDERFFIRIDLCDSCPGMHFLKRSTIIDISPIKCFLTKNIHIKNHIYIQHPISFIIGIYDKYAGCVLNVNKLCPHEQKITKEKLELRINSMHFEKDIIKPDLFKALYICFNNIHQSNEAKNMLGNKLSEICGKNILEILGI